MKSSHLAVVFAFLAIVSFFIDHDLKVHRINKRIESVEALLLSIPIPFNTNRFPEPTNVTIDVTMAVTTPTVPTLIGGKYYITTDGNGHFSIRDLTGWSSRYVVDSYDKALEHARFMADLTPAPPSPTINWSLATPPTK